MGKGMSAKPQVIEITRTFFLVEKTKNSDGNRLGTQTRQLSDGSEYVMVENDPPEDDLRRIFEPWSRNLRVHIGNYWWWIRYELP